MPFPWLESRDFYDLASSSASLSDSFGVTPCANRYRYFTKLWTAAAIQITEVNESTLNCSVLPLFKASTPRYSREIETLTGTSDNSFALLFPKPSRSFNLTNQPLVTRNRRQIYRFAFFTKSSNNWRNTMQTQKQTQHFTETADLFIPLSEDE